VFDNYIRFMKRFPEVQFITATEAAKIYGDKARGRKFTPDELKAIAAASQRTLTFKTRRRLHASRQRNFHVAE